MQEFIDFKAISGLGLTLPKTVVIPLWTSNIHAVGDAIAAKLPAWHGVEVKDCGAYLGFCTGPGKENKSWERAITPTLKILLPEI